MASKDQDPKQHPAKSLIQQLLDQVRQRIMKPPEKSYFDAKPEPERPEQRRPTVAAGNVISLKPEAKPLPPRDPGLTRKEFNRDPAGAALREQQELQTKYRHENTRQQAVDMRARAEELRQVAHETWKQQRADARLLLEGLPRHLPIPEQIGLEFNRLNNGAAAEYHQKLEDIETTLEQIEVEIQQQDWKLSNEAILLITHQQEPEAPDVTHVSPEPSQVDDSTDWVAQFNRAAAPSPEGPSMGGPSR